MSLRLEIRGSSASPSSRLTRSLLIELHRRLDAADALPFGPIVLQGAPGSFCEGLDLDGPGALETRGEQPSSAAQIEDGLEALARLLDRLQRVGRPVIALVDGPALGGGLGIAAIADLVLATPRATFGLPESLIGLIPALVFPPIARRIGVTKARLLALGGKPLDASAALRDGLVDELAPDLEAALARHARRLERADPRAVKALKGLCADHYAAPPRYREDAVAAFRSLHASAATQARIRRFAEGLAPWDEDDR